MSGVASKLAHNRERSHGTGTQAAKYLDQDCGALRESCLETGQLFEDDCCRHNSLCQSTIDSRAVYNRGLLTDHPYSLTGAEQVEYNGEMVQLINLIPLSKNKAKISLMHRLPSCTDDIVLETVWTICNLPLEYSKWVESEFEGTWRNNVSAGGIRNFIGG
ncbi:unnamed protein product [Pleuronectes platessa]|uniref:Uncharacterized protein n=1 Tax=Pleuronectes platessa TaxID=8262 RepID=A0A9N7Z741_PLEPL|nr:unnamed protein product [Pleuronectes platessa]